MAPTALMCARSTWNMGTRWNILSRDLGNASCAGYRMLVLFFMVHGFKFRGILWFAKVLRKSKLSEPSTHMRSLCKNTSTTTKNKSYFIKLVDRTIK